MILWEGYKLLGSFLSEYFHSGYFISLGYIIYFRFKYITLPCKLKHCLSVFEVVEVFEVVRHYPRICMDGLKLSCL